MLGLSAMEFFVFSVLLFVLLYWISPKKLQWLPFLILTILFSVLAYNATPNDTDDLSRYFHTLYQLKDGGYDLFKHRIDEGFMEWDTYRVCGYYFYYMSKLPSVHYFPAVTIFISYGLMFLVIYKAARKFNAGKLYLFIGTMFFISTYWYYDTFSGIRNGLAFAVICACAYYHLVERKRIPLCIVGYVLACLLHSTGAMFVVLIFVVELTLNNKGKFLNFLLVFGLAGGGFLIQYLAERTDNTLIQSIAGRAETTMSRSSLLTSTLFLTNVMVVVVVAITVLYFSKYITDNEPSVFFKRFYKFSSIMVYFMIGCIYSPLVFMRFARWVMPFAGAIMYIVGAQLQREDILANDEYCLNFFAPTAISFRYRMRAVYNIIMIGFTAIHFWYLCAGSSLLWIHF